MGSAHDCCGLDLLLKEVKNVNMASLEVLTKLFNTKFNKKKNIKICRTSSKQE